MQQTAQFHGTGVMEGYDLDLKSQFNLKKLEKRESLNGEMGLETFVLGEFQRLVHSRIFVYFARN